MRPSNADVLDALRVLRSYFGPDPQAAAVPQWADLRQHGPGVYRRALAAIRAGELRAYQVTARRRLVSVEDWENWLRSSPANKDVGQVEPQAEAARVVEFNRERRRAR